MKDQGEHKVRPYKKRGPPEMGEIMRIEKLFVYAVIFGIVALANFAGAEPQPQTGAVIRLWQGDAPGAQGTADEDIPTLTVFLPPPDKANGASVVVSAPAADITAWPHTRENPSPNGSNSIGVSGFVLKYRLGPKYHHPVMMEDVNRAIRMVRSHAREWSLDPARIGVLGFSAGGHLASTAVTHFDSGRPDSQDSIEQASSRPDFGVLIYPVITMTDPYTHRGSRTNLLGKEPPQDLIDLMSSEKQVTDKTPPCFLVHSATDGAVPIQNSLMFVEACLKQKVPVELHMFDHGPHGFGLGGNDPALSQWPVFCEKWMNSHAWLKAREK